MKPANILTLIGEEPKATPNKLKSNEAIYLEYLNDWLTVSRMAEYYQMEEAELSKIIETGKKEHLQKFETTN